MAEDSVSDDAVGGGGVVKKRSSTTTTRTASDRLAHSSKQAGRQTDREKRRDKTEPRERWMYQLVELSLEQIESIK